MSSYRSTYYDGLSRRYGSGSSSTSTAPPISYRSPFTTGSRDRSTSRGRETTSALIDKYGTKEGAGGERLSLKDKFNYSSTYPGRKAAEEEEERKKNEKARDLSAYSRTLGRSSSVKSRDLSPEPPPDKGVYGSSSGGSLSSYRLYGRGSTYSRSNSRDAGDSTSSTSSTPATTPVQIPTSLRFGSSTRYGVSIARSPVAEKPPPIFGVSSDRYSRFSRTTSTEDKKDHLPVADTSSTLTLKSPPVRSQAPVTTTKAAENTPRKTETKQNECEDDSSTSSEDSSDEDEQPPTIYITVITRGTSPTPPSSSIYVRSRRADLARVIEKTIAKPTKRPKMVDKDIQSDRGDDTAKLSRFGSSCRSSASPWSSYLDRYGTGSPYSSRYSSRLDRYGSYGSSSSRSSDKDTSATSKDRADLKSPSSEPTARALGTGSSETKSSVTSQSLLSEKSSPINPPLSKEMSSTSLSSNSKGTCVPKVENSPKESNLAKDKPVPSPVSVEAIKETTKIEKPIPKSPSQSTLKSEGLTVKPPSNRTAEEGEKKEKNVPKSPKGTTVKNDVIEKIPTVDQVKKDLPKKEECAAKIESSAAKPPSIGRLADQTSKEIPQKEKEPTKSQKENEVKNDVISRTDSSSSVSKSPSLSRNNSAKNIVGKPPIKSDSSHQVDSTKSKSSSSSSLPDSPVTKTPPLSPLSPSPSKSSTKLDSPEAAAKKLPPPFPKDGASLKPSASLQSLNKLSVVNKDFRKSSLNVELPDPAQVKEFQKTQEKQRKKVKKIVRSSSISSGDSEPSVEQGSTTSLPAAVDKSAAALRISKSLSKLAPGGPAANFLQVPKPGTGSPKRKSPVRTKTPSRSPSRSPSQRRRRSTTRSTSSDSSSSETSCSTSSSDSSSSDEDDKKSTSSSTRRRQRGKRSPATPEKRKSTASIASAKSSADDLSVSADKPPRPPSNAKAQPKNEEAKSFLMRALAPVTNLFKMRQDVSESKSNENIPDAITRTGSNTSLSKTSDKEDTKRSDDEKPKKHRIRHIESGERAWWLDKNSEVPEGILRIQSNKSIAKLAEAVAELQKSDSKSRLRHQLKKQESGERAWWLDSNANIPEGIQKIMSNSSLNQTTDSDSDKKKLPKLNKVKSSRSVAKMSEKGGEKSSLYKIRHQQSGEKAWWLSSSGNIPEGVVRLETSSSDEESSSSETEKKDKEKCGSKADDDGGSVPKFPLTLPETRSRKGSAASGVETEMSKDDSGRHSPYDNVKEQPGKKETSPTKKAPRPKHLPLFISSHTNIDDILGTAATTVEPAMGVAKLKRMLEKQDAEPSDDEDLEGQSSGCEEVDATQVRIHDSTAKKPSIKQVRNVAGDMKKGQAPGMIKLDDTALQLYKDGDYGSYLDLEASINEQHEEFEGFQDNRKNSIVLRTQLSVRVHTIIEKLLNSEGRELRRALFSLKQIFQEDKDLVHEFVQNDGLACLIKVGSEADQNYQNYILRALGQVMLYVDGMNGVMDHNQTVQWLYTLIASKYRLVVKTALKLLLVFVEYVEGNCLLLIKAVHAVDTSHGHLPWSNIMKLLKDYDAADTELLIYATTLVNKTLNGIPDQDTYYDQVDALEEQGIEGAIQRYMSKQGTDLDLLHQLQIYEAVLHHEDGEEKGTPLKQLDETIRKTLRNRKCLNESVSTERRKSRRHSTGTSPLSSSLNNSTRLNNSSLHTSTLADDEETESSSSRSSPVPGDVHINGNHREGKGDVGVTPALRRRRERAERQRSFIREQQETAATLKATLGNAEDDVEDENQKHSRIGNGSLDGNDVRSSNKLQLNRVSSRKDMTPLLNAVNSAESESKAADTNGILKKPWVLSMMYGKNADGTENGEVEEGKLVTENGTEDGSERKKLLQLKRENTVKDLTQKLASQNILSSPVDEGNNKINRIGDMTGLISKAKEGLAKSKSKADIAKSPTGENIPKALEVKKSETELHWEELLQAMKRPLSLCDLDFTDLNSEDEVDILSPTNVSNGGPPPPPPVPMAPGMPRSGAPPPPPPVSRFSNVTAPPPFPPTANSSPAFGINVRNNRNNSSATDSSTNKSPTSPVKKTKKTVKLFWKEVRDDPIILAKLQKTGMIWDELNPVIVDTQKLEHLFESRAKDLITKEKQQEMNKNKEIIVLDHKRSNAINIGMTKLPPPRSIKTAILKMDATIMNREGIEKLLTMLPTEEERSKIQEAQMANPDLPLGSAEQFLLTLASISELPARLKLWAFKLDYENSEKEIAEPLMDLKQGMETLKANKTFRGILSTLLSIGIFLNGNEVKGFQIEYLAKVPEVKDTVHKHSLLHHLCHMVMEKFPDSSDLYSEIGAVTRASKVDFDELSANILKMEQECKASWDHLKVIAKHDGSTMMKVKMSDFLADCAERIIVLGIVHRRVMNRFHKFLLWLGIPLHRVLDMKPNEFCRIVSEFSLEYRTTRERVLQQLEKKANHRERNKTRGKMITEVGKFRTKEDRADAELRQLLGSDISDAESIHGTLPWRRQRKDMGRTSLGPLIKDETVNGNLTDGDDEILESLVKTATKAPATRTTPRERKRTRHADRKSLKRSRTRENNPLEGSRESP